MALNLTQILIWKGTESQDYNYIFLYVLNIQDSFSNLDFSKKALNRMYVYSGYSINAKQCSPHKDLGQICTTLLVELLILVPVQIHI